MKRILCLGLLMLSIITFSACGNSNGAKAIELMGAGDRIHDTFTFANVGVKMEETKENVYTISGSISKLENEEVKKEFKIDEDVNYVVAVKLTAIEDEVDKDKLKIMVNGNRSYDAEHLNGSNYTFIILEAIPNNTTTISVKWNEDATEKHYVIYFASDLNLKEISQINN